MDTLRMVQEFHNTFGISIPETPTLEPLPPLAQRKLAQVIHMMKQVSTVCHVFAENHRGTPAGTYFIRLQLIQEELMEFAEGIFNGDIVESLDALGDLQYVVDGSFLTLGLGDLKLPAVAEIHRSNMTKLDEEGKPVLNSAGRVVKGPNYEPPNLAPLLEKKD